MGKSEELVQVSASGCYKVLFLAICAPLGNLFILYGKNAELIVVPKFSGTIMRLRWPLIPFYHYFHFHAITFTFIFRDYYGVKMAFYFAWLGYYTVMLIPPSLVSFISF